MTEPQPPGTDASDIIQALVGIYATAHYVQKKTSQNLNYTFAGESDYISVVRPAMVALKVVMYPVAYDEITHETYQTSRGGSMNRVTLRATFRFHHAPSGTFIDVQSLGEGADVGDKATNKAQTSAKKYALNQAFLIATGDDPDETPSGEQRRGQGAPPPWNIPDWWPDFADKVKGLGIRPELAKLLDIDHDAGVRTWCEAVEEYGGPTKALRQAADMKAAKQP